MLRFGNILRLAAAVLVGGAILAAPSQARADFKVTITDSVNTYTFTDAGSPGVITVAIGDSAYSVIGTISTSNSPGDPDLAQIDVSYTMKTAGKTGGQLVLSASSNGFTAPTINPLTLTSTINGNGSGNGTLSVQSYADTSNTLFGEGGATSGPQGPFTIGAAGGYGSVGTTKFNQVGAYSITDVLTFNMGTNQNTSGDSQVNITPAPAPSALLLVASGLPMFGVAMRFRRRKLA